MFIYSCLLYCSSTYTWEPMVNLDCPEFMYVFNSYFKKLFSTPAGAAMVEKDKGKFMMEKISGMRVKGGKKQLLVKWKGYLE